MLRGNNLQHIMLARATLFKRLQRDKVREFGRSLVCTMHAFNSE